MLDFEYYVPTRIIFGRDRIKNLSSEIRKYADRVLVLYGGGSIKRFGLYEKVIKILDQDDIFYCELSGVKPNPRIKQVRKGVDLCRENNLKLILAVGGGSTIDCAKAISAGACYEGDPWDFFIGKSDVKEALPIGSILTLSATGSEMNGNTVISNEEVQLKLPLHSELLRPRFSILDPMYTYTVPEIQTAAGTVDIFSHICEQYFSPVKDTYVEDRLAEALFKTCIKFGPVAVKEPDHYDARANLMWASSLALNGLISCGKPGDWATHFIEHAVSAVYDVTHGVGLAILTPHWMEYVLEKDTLWRFVEYAKNVWDLDSDDELELAREAITKTREFFSELGMPCNLSEVGVDDSRIADLVDKAMLLPEIGVYKKLNRNDVRKILEMAM